MRPADRSLERHFSRQDVADLLGVSLSFVKEEMASRRLAFVKLGDKRRSKVLIAESAVREWLDRRGRVFPAADTLSANGSAPQPNLKEKGHETPESRR